MFLTYANKVTTKATMKRLNYSLGAVPNKPCKYCAVAKSKQKNICKTTPRIDLKKGEGWFIDLSNIKWVALSHKKFWALFVDYETYYCVSKFLQNKEDLKEEGLKLFKKICAMNIQVKMLQMNNAGENKLLQKALKAG